ncbi:MAG TPA: alpha/beta hydrolase [Vicinamibacterales bacterium]|nr:alpha/beta hydrolase [Vicinamibacterales bacterium]
MTQVVAVVTVAILILVGVLYRRAGTASDARLLPPPGRMVDIGGDRRLHLQSQGTGGPTVVFEAGISASSLSWARVQPAVAEFARTFSYDRAGLAWSDASTAPITATRCATQLHQMLDAAAVPGPCVFVSHSYGAFVLQAYAQRHPRNVAALVLVDPIYPEEWIDMTRKEAFRLRGGVFLSRVGAVVASTGFVRACLALLAGGSTVVPRGAARLFGSEAARTLDRLAGEVRKMPVETWPAVQSHWSQPKCFVSMARHLDGLRTSAAEVARCALPPGVPLVVITAATQSAAYRAEHERMAARSTRGRHLVARGSGHWVHLDEPELVIEAIRGVCRLTS